jgi:hypothetical protein
MQKDVHFYVTYALARKAGLTDDYAEKIAWADQFTDDMSEAVVHGIQTQSSDIAGNWGDKQIQATILVPFHFIPGKDKDHPWKTTPNNFRARRLVNGASRNGNLFQLGIALHGLQDTFSHQGFSGWHEKLNSCFPWYYLTSALPNIGHAEMRVIPDVTNYTWTDPRNGQKIYNWKRAVSAARETYEFLRKVFNDAPSAHWPSLESKLKSFFRLDNYDERKGEIRRLSGRDKISYTEVDEKLRPQYEDDFIYAAKNHLSSAMKLFSQIPSVLQQDT